jgi:hypothetical protein
MDILRQAAQAVLEAYDQHDPLGVVMADLRAALAQPERNPLTEFEVTQLCDSQTSNPKVFARFKKLLRMVERAHGIE